MKTKLVIVLSLLLALDLPAQQPETQTEREHEPSAAPESELERRNRELQSQVEELLRLSRQQLQQPPAAPLPTPNAELLQAAEAAEATAKTPWLLIERGELLPAKGTIIAGLVAGGENPMPPDRTAFHSATEPIVTRQPDNTWKITFK